MPKQGGGVTRHSGVETYIDLIVGDLSSIEKEYPQTYDLFTAFAKHRQGSSNFGYAEIDKDKRMYNELSKTKKGKILYKTIKSKLPLITVSNSILSNIDTIDNVKIYKLIDIEKDPLETLNRIQETAQLKSEADKKEFLDGIEKLNKIISIKPGFFGVSINLNGIIDEWLKGKRKRMSPSPSMQSDG